MGEKPWQETLPQYLDHTVLRPEATKADVLRLCAEAKEQGFVVIFVPPSYVDEAVKAVAGTEVQVGIPIGFPLGGHSPTEGDRSHRGRLAWRQGAGHGHQYQPSEIRRLRLGTE